ncbi:MAG: hypothetical protein WD646_13970 [Actinomycetota bacterium]
MTWRFRVDERIKGPLGSHVDVRSPNSGASCGFEPRGKVGIFLQRRGDEWTGGLCSQIAPEELRKAAQPLPIPDGSEPLALLVGGNYGEARTIGLDGSGRILRYGFGESNTSLMSVCPGSRFAIEVVTADSGPPFGSSLAVRDLETFDVVREDRIVELDVAAGERSLGPRGVACRDPTAGDVLVFGSSLDNGETHQDARLVRVRGGSRFVIWEGAGKAAALPAGGLHAVVATTTRELVKVDIGSGRTEEIGKLPAHPGFELAMSPDEVRVAGVTGDSGSGVFVADLENGGLRTENVREMHRAVWAGDDRLVVVPGGRSEVRVFDASLRSITAWRTWPGGKPVAVGDALFALEAGRLSTASVLDGQPKLLRVFDAPEMHELVAVPQRAPAPVPTPSPTAIPNAQTPDSSSPVWPAVATGLGAGAMALGGAFLRRRAR